MTHAAILKKVCESIDVLIDVADDYEGLFPAMIDLGTHKIPDELPPKLGGQRNEDRSFPGCNLLHDLAALKTMYTLSESLNRPDYAQAADRYLKRFATHCTDTVTGLFPWGEHSFWNLVDDKVGNAFPLAYDWWKEPAIHDHLRAAPFWLWEKLYEYNPKCVGTFAEGVDYHWNDIEPLEYNRHARIEAKARMPHEERSCDFPRYGGFFIMDWAFAYVKTGRKDFLEQIHRMLDYWWSRRLPHGMLPLETRTPERAEGIYNLTAPFQASSLGTSLLDTAEFIEDKEPELAATMRERGTVYAESHLSLPHDLENEVYVWCTKQDTGEIVSSGSSGWASGAGAMGSICIDQYRKTGNEDFFGWAESVGRGYVHDPIPDDAAIRAGGITHGIGLMVDLYEITGSKGWLDTGLKAAEKAIEVCLDADLPRGAAGVGHYEALHGTGRFLEVLAEIALLPQTNEGPPVKSD